MIKANTTVLGPQTFTSVEIKESDPLIYKTPILALCYLVESLCH